jgi:hypothetical protein
MREEVAARHHIGRRNDAIHRTVVTATDEKALAYAGCSGVWPCLEISLSQCGADRVDKAHPRSITWVSRSPHLTIALAAHLYVE